MELDQLKKSYKKSEVKYSSEELKSIFEIRTQGSIKSINNKMLIDALLMILMTLVLITITFTLGLRSKYMVSGQIAGFGIILLLHYRLKYFLLNNINFERNDIRSAIRKVFKIFKMYWYGYQIIIPAMTITLFAFVNEYAVLLKNIGPLFIYPIVGLISFFITSSLLKTIYGAEFKKLKELNDSILNQTENHQIE